MSQFESHSDGTQEGDQVDRAEDVAAARDVAAAAVRGPGIADANPVLGPGRRPDAGPGCDLHTGGTQGAPDQLCIQAERDGPREPGG